MFDNTTCYLLLATTTVDDDDSWACTRMYCLEYEEEYCIKYKNSEEEEMTTDGVTVVAAADVAPQVEEANAFVDSQAVTTALR